MHLPFSVPLLCPAYLFVLHSWQDKRYNKEERLHMQGEQMSRRFTLEYWVDEGWYIGRLKEIPASSARERPLKNWRKT